MIQGMIIDTCVRITVDPTRTTYIRGYFIEDQTVFWTAGACAATASLENDDGPSASGEQLMIWLCCCVDGLKSAICRSIKFWLVRMTPGL